MAKKATAETIEVAPQEVVVKTAPKKQEYTKQNEWEFKDRVYFLKGDLSPLTLTIPSKHTKKHALLYFDPNTGSQKEIRYATNQASPLKEEQTGEATLGHVRFHDGTLKVSKEKQNLQKLLSIYHPLKNKIYQEFSAIAIAEDELDVLDLQIDALNAARDMDVDHSEAILRVELGSKVSTMSSKELRRDLLLFARKSPQLFIDLANDENVQLRNVALRASEVGIIKLSQDQRTFMWGSNDRKLMTVPFDENPYSAMAAYFKTDEGVEVFRSIEKKMN